MLKSKFKILELHEFGTPGQDYICWSNWLGIIIVWDEDRDARILDVIFAMPIGVISNLFAVHERKGCIEILWKGETPMGYEPDELMIDVPDGDSWIIVPPNMISIDMLMPILLYKDIPYSLN